MGVGPSLGAVVVVANRHRQHLLGGGLAYHVAVLRLSRLSRAAGPTVRFFGAPSYWKEPCEVLCALFLVKRLITKPKGEFQRGVDTATAKRSTSGARKASIPAGSFNKLKTLVAGPVDGIERLFVLLKMPQNEPRPTISL